MSQFDFFQNFTNPEGMFKNMKFMPMMDFTSMASMMKANADVIASTNQMASESVQSIMKRGAESLQRNVNEFFSSMKEAVSSGNMEQVIACQNKYVKSATEHGFGSVKEMMEIASKSTMEIVDVISNNVSENISKSMAKNSKSKMN